MSSNAFCLWVASIGAIAALATPTSGAVLLGYDFETSANVFAPDLQAGGVSGSDLTVGSGFNLTASGTADNSGDPFGSSSASSGVFANPGYGSEVNESAAVADNDFVSFTISPTGNPIDLDTVSFKYRRKGDGAPTNFFVRSSFDLNTTIGSGALTGTNNSTSDATFASASITLDSSFDAVSGPVTFNVYFYGASNTSLTDTNNVIRLDKFAVSGTVPEPGAFVGGLVGLSGLLWRRRGSASRR